MLNGWLGAALVAGGYLLGSIPFGIVAARLLGTTDPRTAGSKNIGFTNVLRVAGKKAGVLTLIGDMGKGWLAGAAAGELMEEEAWVLVVALSPVLGHLFPVFLRFRGGKGVATAMGSVLGIAPGVGAAVILIWLASVGLWRYSSGGALTAFAALPIVAVLSERSGLFVGFAVVTSALIMTTHRDNILRLWRGVEPRIGRQDS